MVNRMKEEFSKMFIVVKGWYRIRGITFLKK